MLFPTIHNLYEVNALVEKEHEVEERVYENMQAYVMPK